MSRKIVGVTVGTPISTEALKKKLDIKPGSGGNVDLTGYATEQFVRDGYQPKGDYLESSQLQPAIDTALAQAKESGAFDGPEGPPGKDGANGAPGKDGKDYVLTPDDKTEIAEMAAKLVDVPDSPGSGIHVGPDAPTDENVNVWIDTDEEPEEAPETGSGIDVTAEVGQTIIVEEVDENGKPTKWKAVDFPEGGSSAPADWNANEGDPGHILNRTHYMETGDVILPETIFEGEDGQLACVYSGEPFTPSEIYEVTYNGHQYLCKTMITSGLKALGFDPTTGRGMEFPFLIAHFADEGMLMCAALDGAESVTISIAKVVVHPLAEYILANRRYEVDFNSLELNQNNISSRNYDDIATALNSGRTVVFVGNTEGLLMEATVTGWTWGAEAGLIVNCQVGDKPTIMFTNGTWTPMG